MRADRLLSILMLLQARGRLTARALAGELEVSVRTIYRDVDALSAAGVPVYTDRGPGGGISLLESYRTTLTGLTRDQVRALFMLTIPAPLAELGLDDDLKAAFHKLAAALPASSRPDEQSVRQRVHLDPVGWFEAGEPVPLLRALQQGVWEDRCLQLTYSLPFGAQAEWRVEPYGLVAKSGVWYLVCRRAAGSGRVGRPGGAPAGGDARVLRVSRILGARLLDEGFSRPPAFDLAAFWRDWCQAEERNQPRFSVTVRVAPDLLPFLPRLFGDAVREQLESEEPPDSRGWRRLVLDFESLEAARARLLGLGAAVEVLAPPALRNSIADFAAQVAALYGAGESGAEASSGPPA